MSFFYRPIGTRCAAHPRVWIATIADLLLLRFVRTHSVRAMSHWEASPFDTKDGQDVVKAKGPHVVSEGWERVASGGGASSGGSFVASLAAPLGVLPLTGDGSSTSLPHWQKAFLLLVGGFVVFYIRRLLRSQRRPARAAAVSEVDAPACTSLHRPAPPPRTGPCTVLRPLVTSPPRLHITENLLPGHTRAAACRVTRPRAQPACSKGPPGGRTLLTAASPDLDSPLQQPRPGQPPLQRSARPLEAILCSFWTWVRGEPPGLG